MAMPSLSQARRPDHQLRVHLRRPLADNLLRNSHFSISFITLLVSSTNEGKIIYHFLVSRTVDGFAAISLGKVLLSGLSKTTTLETKALKLRT